MKCLSVRQPWAWLIIHGGKDVENRAWRTHYTGPLLIHAAKTPGRPASAEIYRITTLCGIDPVSGNVNLLYGAIIGRVHLAGCINGSDSPWSIPGDWHWLLADPEPLGPIPYQGRQGLFDVEVAV